MTFNCDDCGSEMSEPCLCLVMFSPLDEHIKGEGFQRISNLCERCRTFKRNDVRAARPLSPRLPTRVFKAPSKFSIAFELFRGRRIPEPVGLTGKPLWLYGKGELGQLAQDFFRYVGVEVAGTFEHDEPAPLDAQVAVCIVRNSPYGAIEKKLFDRGFTDVVPFYDLADSCRGDHPLENGWIGRPDATDCEKIEGILDRWSDDVSRCHYLQFLAWRILREEWMFKGEDITKDNLFFIPEVVSVLHDHEVFLDGGAYDGEISRKFADLAPGAEIIAIEPDVNNIAKMVLPKGNSVVSAVALSDLDDRAPFAEGFGVASKLTPSGKAKKITRRIDSLDVSPTFIKLHLEGGDLAALRGGADTLVRCRSIVAVRIDHNSDGLWRTADYLMTLLSNYRFLFRNHCWCGSAAVVYAIPEERCATR